MKKKYLLFSWFILFFAGCKTSQEKYIPHEESYVRDNFWLAEDTLQLIVKISPGKMTEPVVITRKKACETAKKEIIPRFHKLYPKSQNISPVINIVYTMNLKNGGCAQVVQITYGQLREKIS